MVLRLISCSPRCPGSFATVISGIASTNWTPASGCQDHTTSPSAQALFVNSAAASTASHPASVTIAIRPSVGWDGVSFRSDLGQTGNGIFLQTGLDDPNHVDPLQQISVLAHGGYDAADFARLPGKSVCAGLALPPSLRGALATKQSSFLR